MTTLVNGTVVSDQTMVRSTSHNSGLCSHGVVCAVYAAAPKLRLPTVSSSTSTTGSKLDVSVAFGDDEEDWSFLENQGKSNAKPVGMRAIIHVLRSLGLLTIACIVQYLCPTASHHQNLRLRCPHEQRL